MARAFGVLMERLGYEAYGVQGGDWGAAVSRLLYWLTGTVGSAARVYYERAHADDQGSAPQVSSTPTALADFPATTSSRCGT